MNKYEEHKKVTEALDSVLTDAKGESPGGSKHYMQGGMQPKDLFIQNNLPAYKALAIKYIFRAGHKGDEDDPVLDELRDLRKAIFWINERYKYLVGEMGQDKLDKDLDRSIAALKKNPYATPKFTSRVGERSPWFGSRNINRDP